MLLGHRIGSVRRGFHLAFSLRAPGLSETDFTSRVVLPSPSPPSGQWACILGHSSPRDEWILSGVGTKLWPEAGSVVLKFSAWGSLRFFMSPALQCCHI